MRLDRENAIAHLSRAAFDSFVREHGGFSGHNEGISGLLVTFMDLCKATDFFVGAANVHDGLGYAVLDEVGRRRAMARFKCAPELEAKLAAITTYNDQVNLRKGRKGRYQLVRSGEGRDHGRRTYLQCRRHPAGGQSASKLKRSALPAAPPRCVIAKA